MNKELDYSDVMVCERNSAKCAKCGDEIESTHRHDFVWCSCKSIAVDGGTSYLKRIGSLQNFIDTSVFRQMTLEELVTYHGYWHEQATKNSYGMREYYAEKAYVARFAAADWYDATVDE